MILLHSTHIPTTAEALCREVDTSLREMFVLPQGDKAVITRGDWPNLDELRIDLDGARVRKENLPQRPEAVKRDEQGQPGLRVARLLVHGRPIHVEGSQINLAMDAEDVRFVFAHDEKGRLLMLPDDAKAGRAEVSIGLADLESLLLTTTNAALGKAVNIVAASISLTQSGARSLGFEARITAKKFISTVVRVAGRLEIDDRLDARLCDLSCAGEGMVGKAVGGLIGPHLQKLEGRQWPLAGPALGRVRLRDARIDAANGLHVTAEFGA